VEGASEPTVPVNPSSWRIQGEEGGESPPQGKGGGSPSNCASPEGGGSRGFVRWSRRGGGGGLGRSECEPVSFDDETAHEYVLAQPSKLVVGNNFSGIR
jgi:hypothetical protein